MAPPPAPRFSVASAGSRQPTRAAPTAGLLRVRRNANHDRLLSGFRGKALAILDGRQLVPRRPAKRLVFAYSTGILTGEGLACPPPPRRPSRSSPVAS